MPEKPEAPRRAARRSRTGRFGGLARRWFASLEVPWLWSAFFLLCGIWVLMPEGLMFAPDVAPESIAQRNYTAPREFLAIDEEATESKRNRARDTVLPVYDFDRERSAWLSSQVSTLFAEARAALDANRDLNGEELLSVLGRRQLTPTLRISPEQLELFRQLDLSGELEERMDGVWRSMMNRGVVANKELLLENRFRGITLRDLSDGSEKVQLDLFDTLGYAEEVRQYLEAELSRWVGVNRAARQTVVGFLLQNTTPNLTFNLRETNDRRSRAAEAVEPVYNQVRRGQIIVRRGDEITPATRQLIREAFGGTPSAAQWLPVLGNLLLLLMALAAVRYGLERTRIGEGREARTLGGVLFLLGSALLTTRLGISVATALADSFQTLVPIPSRAYLYGLPYAALALLVSLFYGRGVGLLTAMVYSLLVGRMLGPQALWGVLFVAAGSLAAVFALDRLNQRLAVTRAGSVVGLVGVAAVAMLSAFEGGVSLGELGFLLAAPLFGGLLVAAVASFLVPLLESVLGHTTEIRFIELSDTNLPILRRLAFEAPGTFQHSLMVANLAKAGCEAIGANSVLAYTAALYHDIGKVTRPIYFVENQRGVNPHDKLAPSMSALIVLNHVKEGVDLAREHGLPQSIIDGIEQHHGNRLLTFFHEKAREGAPEGTTVDEHKFRYPGPRPQSKTMGVLMYADAVEAASRTLRNPTPQNIDSLLERLLNDCLSDDQFDETDLTLSDLRRVREAFARILGTIYHKRIDYPGYDFEKAARAELRMIRGGGGRT